MHDAHDFLVNLALVLCVAAVTTVVFQRLRQPVVLGYLLAGAIVSPHTPFPIFADEGMVHALSELGVILLMFSLGLEFSFAKLWRVGPSAGVVAVLQCTLMVWLGYITGQWLGWTVIESIYVGAMIAISSTTIIVKAFAEQQIRGARAETVFGILIVEDLIAIFLLAVLTTLSSGTSVTASGLAATAGKLAGFLVLVVGVGMLLVPRLVRAIVRLDRPETTLVSSVGLCFALALLAQSMGYSVALGAFLAGMLVSESGEAEVVEHLVQPVRDMFAAIFFVAVGMLIDPLLIASHWTAVVGLTVVVVIGKLVGVAIGVFLTGQGVRASVHAGMSLAQIGEFSFIIAGLGLSLGATRSFLYPVAVAVSAITTLLTPWLIRAADPAAAFFDRHLPQPIQTFASLYGTWVEKLRNRPQEPTIGRRVRHLGRLLFLDGAALAAVAIATAVWGPRAAAVVGDTLGVPVEVRWAAVLISAAVVSAPFCIGIMRCTAALARVLATAALPGNEGGVDIADAPRRVLLVTIEFGLILLVCIPLVAVTQPFLPSLPGAVLLVLIGVWFAVALWRSASNLQEHARAGAGAIVELLGRQGRGGQTGPDPEESDDLAHVDRLLPGLGAPVPIRVGPDSAAVGQTLTQLNMRGLTGATVLAIVRNDDSVIFPNGRETLAPNDVLAVAGTAAAIAAAKRLPVHPAPGV